ncbi:MAG TPA: hypothetical protein VNE60_03665 [Gemmatimonadaceae bacterium]|nr:hypothetical protein [Gemmatimonadaceae bacterium]
MRISIVLAAAVALVSATATSASAQGRGRDNASSPPKEAPHIITSDSIERLNPITPLIEHRKDIGLPDSLIGKLGAILAQLDAANARLLQQADSLAAHPGGPVVVSDDVRRDDRDAAGHRPVTLAGIITQVMKNNDDAGQKALLLLPSASGDRALRLMNDQRNRLGQLLRDSGSGGGNDRGRDGGGPPDL